MPYDVISASVHNHLIAKDVEIALNRLIDAVNESGGTIWLQSKENKEHYYKLTGNVSLGFYIPNRYEEGCS